METAPFKTSCERLVEIFVEQVEELLGKIAASRNCSLVIKVAVAYVTKQLQEDDGTLAVAALQQLLLNGAPIESRDLDFFLAMDLPDIPDIPGRLKFHLEEYLQDCEIMDEIWNYVKLFLGLARMRESQMPV